MSTKTHAVRPSTAVRLASSASSRRRLTRACAVLGAAVATSCIQVAATALGVDFLLSDSMGAVVISLPIVAAFTVIFGLLGWGSLALLEKLTRRARGIWTGLALVVTALSLIPIFLEEATTGTRLALAVIHIAVAAILIPMLRRDARTAASA